MRSKLKR